MAEPRRDKYSSDFDKDSKELFELLRNVLQATGKRVGGYVPFSALGNTLISMKEQAELLSENPKISYVEKIRTLMKIAKASLKSKTNPDEGEKPDESKKRIELQIYIKNIELDDISAGLAVFKMNLEKLDGKKLSPIIKETEEAQQATEIHESKFESKSGKR